jgi:hypothetical protein
MVFSSQVNFMDQSPNFSTNLVDSGVLRGRRDGTPTAVNLSFLDRSRDLFSFKQLLVYPHEAEWASFQTHLYSENLGAPGIEPGTSVSTA